MKDREDVIREVAERLLKNKKAESIVNLLKTNEVKICLGY